MKTRTWILMIGVLFLLCAGLSLWLLLPGEEAAAAEVWSEGRLLYTLELNMDQKVTVTGDRGSNEITVKNGKIAVTQADCPDGYCMDRGWCSNGAEIVCLPNRLVIRFVEEGTLDGISG